MSTTPIPAARTAKAGLTEPLRVLFLEDDPDFPELAKSILEEQGFRLELAVVQNFAAFVAALEENTFDIILADYQLPTCTGTQALRAAREQAPETPFVLVSGVIGEETAIESLKAGATDYVLKSGINRLVPAVRRALHNALERKRAEDDLKKAQAELALASRLAGMAEAATSVLHNVGNVLNSVNISVGLVSDELKKSRLAGIARVANLMRKHADNIGDFMTRDAKGRQLPDYLTQLADYLRTEQSALLREMEQIRLNVEHIKDIVAIQQNYSQIAGTSVTVRVTDLVEDALRLNAGELLRHDVQIVREYAPGLPEITVERHKVLQILMNLIHNAKYACAESGQPGKRITLRIGRGGNGVSIAVVDNGVGIAPEHFARLFTQGFTTRKGGHGLNLHYSALAAQSLGGALRAHSDGKGKGATFTLELPLTPPAH
jgi:signal transduction histidine kinase